MKVTSNAGTWTGAYLEMITRKDKEDHPAVARIRDRMQSIEVTIEFSKKEFDGLPSWFKHVVKVED